MHTYNLKVKDIEFTIDRDNIAWGDGEHHSTAFMLDAISRYGVKDKTVLDIGTGSGILSVLCGKLGAKSILAVDIDPHVLDVAKHNFEANGVEVEVKRNDLTHGITEQYDVVLANLHFAVQFENVKTVANVLKDDGLLIMTWKNNTRFEDHVKGFEVIEHVAGEDYDGYVLRKKQTGGA